jgi:hypothetical protein
MDEGLHERLGQDRPGEPERREEELREGPDVDHPGVRVGEVALPEAPAVRACVTSFRTTEADVDVLVGELERARLEVGR